MMLGEIIHFVVDAFGPIDPKERLRDFVTQPVPTHVPCFGAALFDVLGDKAVSGGIVGLEWDLVLGVPKFLKGNSDGDAGLSIAKDTARFGLCCGGYNVGNGFAVDQNGTVEFDDGYGRWGRRTTSKKKQTRIAASGAGFDQVSCIRDDPQLHATGMVADGGIRVRMGVIHEHVATVGCVFRRSRLTSAKVVEGHQHGGINAPGIVKERANHGLNLPCALLVEARGDVDWCHLDALAVGRLRPFVWGMLGTFGWRMLETNESGVDITRHGYVHVPAAVIPIHCEATIMLAVPVN
jgi:hypothetical protein